MTPDISCMQIKRWLLVCFLCVTFQESETRIYESKNKLHAITKIAPSIDGEGGNTCPFTNATLTHFYDHVLVA